jgi:hypothetical protein
MGFYQEKITALIALLLGRQIKPSGFPNQQMA